jgi:arylformamidase
MNDYIDVTIPLKTGQMVYPTDSPCEIKINSKISEGSAFNISSLSLSAHTGTHIDAPYHFIDRGKKIDEISLKHFIGRAKVFDFSDNDRCVDLNDIKDKNIEKGDIVLLKTKNSKRLLEKDFFENYVYLTGGAAKYLARKQIITFGFDYITIDKYGVLDYPAHYKLLGDDIVIIEGINLTDIKEGNYDIIALPLKIENGDGAPARVLLKKIDC